jgi:hypothetical protein
MQLLRSKKCKRSSKQTVTDDTIQQIQESKKTLKDQTEVVQLDDDSDNNIEQQSRFAEDFQNAYRDLNNLEDDLINDSVNEEDIERLPLYQILNESLMDNDEDFLDNNAISINLPEQSIQEISPGVEQQQPQSQSPLNEPSTSGTPDAVFKNFDKLATSINDFYIPNANNEKTHNIKILL